MITTKCQRWREGRSSYRPAGEVVDPTRYEVAPIAGDAEAKRFVEAHHYSGSYPAARRRFGLYRGGELVGVAVYSVPCNSRVITNVLDLEDWRDAVELGRFVLLDEVPANGESWFLAKTFKALKREGFAGVVSFSDPCARRSQSGEVVFAGHVGTIYQATNARYVGRGTARSLRLLPDGTVFSARTAQKIRSRSKGWRYAVEQLREHGAPPLGDQDTLTWLRQSLSQVTRRVRHQGNHKYAWSFVKPGGWSPAATPRPYPKVTDTEPTLPGL